MYFPEILVRLCCKIEPLQVPNFFSFPEIAKIFEIF